LQQWNCKSPTPLHHYPAAAFAQLPEQPTNTHNPTKTPKTINPRQMGNNPPQMETTHKTQNNDARKLKIRINNGSEQEQQQQSRKQSSAIFLNTSFRKAVNNVFSCDDKQHVLIDSFMMPLLSCCCS
jgi:hypothetical protein